MLGEGLPLTLWWVRTAFRVLLLRVSNLLLLVPSAFFATNPAAIITEGFDVFVQLVIAAMTTVPC